MDDPLFDRWMTTLEARHLAELTFPEVSRALRALSSAYVERRARLSQGAALSGAGKRAAFALFYGPLHYLILRHIASALGAGGGRASTIVDLGCGTGSAGAGFAIGSGAASSIAGIDRHGWALAEAARTYSDFGLKGRTIRGDLATVAWPGASGGPVVVRDFSPAGSGGPVVVRDFSPAGSPARGGPDKNSSVLVAAFALNELGDAARAEAMSRLLDRAARGDAVLVVEPLAGFVAPWWATWRRAFEEAGGRADEWRARLELPPIVQKLDRAAGLDHRELTARTLWIGDVRSEIKN